MYGTRGEQDQIVTFWPADDDNTIYLSGNPSLVDIIMQVEDKWPDLSFNRVSITAEHIHTDCIYFDQYDGGDWTEFVVISKLKE